MINTLRLAFTNITRTARLQAPTLVVLVTGYVITILSALIVLGVVEGEQVVTRERYGGDPRDLFVIHLNDSASAPSEVDYSRVANPLC